MYARGNPLRFIDPTGNTDQGAYESGGYYDYYSIQLFSMFNSIDFYSMPMMGNDFVMLYGGLNSIGAFNSTSSGMSWFSALSMMDSGMSMGSSNSFPMNYGLYASTSLAYDYSYSSFGNDYSYGNGRSVDFAEIFASFIPGYNAYQSFSKGNYIGTAVNLAMDIIPFGIGKAAKMGKSFTHSSLEIGQKIHKSYKASLHKPEIGMYKEFNRIKGMRPDFVDFNTRTIYELKPFNPRGIRSGEMQLEKYKKLFEERYGPGWSTILEFY
jgi:hypothetical protein